MFVFIEKLQQQSPSIRRRFALLVSGCVVFVITAIWLLTFDERLLDEETQTAKDNSPFLLLKQEIVRLKNLF